MHSVQYRFHGQQHRYRALTFSGGFFSNTSALSPLCPACSDQDGTEEQADEYLATFGIPLTDGKLELPKLIAFDFKSKSDEKYYYEALDSEEDLIPFLQGVANGSVQPQYQRPAHAVCVS